ncbi:MAG: hypothetical protein OEZ06_19005 [Myxococcales bacterium]|nr:hypothetical protein [Myxococcales bacterium]
MSEGESRRARWREGLIWSAFALILAAAVVTVALPELSRDRDRSGESEEGAASGADGGV